MSLRAKPLNEQEERVVRLHEKNELTFKEIAARLRMSRSRAWQVYFTASAKLKDVAESGSDALLPLPARARRVLVDCKLESRALVRAAIASGHLSWNDGIGSILWQGTRLPKLSRRTWETIYEWAGRPPMPPQPKLIRGYPANGLSSRANDCLSRACIAATKSSVVLALKSGVLSPENGPRGYGKLTHAELCRWSGLDPEQP